MHLQRQINLPLLASVLVSLVAAMAIPTTTAAAAPPEGYYRQPTIHGETIVFVAEGDLWKVSTLGGTASRITTHHSGEGLPAISPDGATLAFTASYEGPTEVYTMPLHGGLPTRRTFDASRCSVAGFAPDGRLLYATRALATLPDSQLILLDLETGARERIELSQAAEGAFSDDGATLWFTRFAKQGSFTKRYHGGTAQNLWHYTLGAGAEATPLTADYTGTSRWPMYFDDRVYFVSDRDGAMNIWSMAADGSQLHQHTHHNGWDIQTPALHDGRIVYQLGADIHLYEIAADVDRSVPIALDTDLDQTREKWITDPMSYVTAGHISPDGDQVVLTARGEVFVAPHRQGRLVHVTRAPDVRYRDARFMPDGETILALSDESGEIEFWTLPANGIGERSQLTEDGKVLRWEGAPSPDGKWIAHHDKDWELWLYNVETREQTNIDEAPFDDFSDLSWSPDSRWLAYVTTTDNENFIIRVYNVETNETTDLTTDRYSSEDPVWSVDGKWIYFLSERHLRSLVGSPWGRLQPEPFFDRRIKIYQIALTDGLRSPFLPDDELVSDEEDDDASDDATDDDETDSDDADGEAVADAEDDDQESDDEPDVVEPIEIDIEGITSQLYDVPVPPGNYGNLMITNDRLLFTALDDRHDPKRDLRAIKIDNDDPKVETIVADVQGVELSADRKKLLIRKSSAIYIIDADAGPDAKLDKKDVNLNEWTFPLTPREEWRQMFTDAWRLERDYFYDRDMHGVDWSAMLAKYLPLVDRVSDRAELADLIAQMVAELAALHIFVAGGDHRAGAESIQPASLGARLVHDTQAGGHRIEHVYESDPDEPQRRAPLARLDLNVNQGDIITMINGVATADVADAGQLLRHQAGRQVRLRIQPADGAETHDVIVTPISARAAANLRYHEWEYTRRLAVDDLGDNDIGYVHLRAMGGGDIAQWARDYYPVFRRKGLIIDVRHNGGGNIDSWILEKLMRKVWFYWQGRVGEPTWNMQYAFRGHMVVLCDERTGSDGEAFAEGFRRLGLGKIIGTRTWGGEIWLTSSNRLVDRGIATAAEFGVYGPEGDWLIEGHGVDPDIVIDNPPYETFHGRDRQLEAAIEHLQELIASDPVDVPPTPDHPDKSFGDNAPG